MPMNVRIRQRVPKCGSKEHRLPQCTNDEVKCVNCVKNNMNNTGHPAYSSVCPYNRKSMS